MNESKKKDQIYSQPLGSVPKFEFNENVTNVFEDMIERSVPGYRDVVDMAGVLASEYAREGTRIYDLGCSLGSVTLSILEKIGSKDCEVIAVDLSKPMVDKCAKRTSNYSNIQVVCEDIQNIEIQNASFIALNYTLQFIEKNERLKLLKKVNDGMVSGGALILSEKISFTSEQEEELQMKWHHAFKKMHGYSELEISQKRTALENILIPESLSEHQKRLQDAGFENINVWFRCFNFLSLIAFKK